MPSVTTRSGNGGGASSTTPSMIPVPARTGTRRAGRRVQKSKVSKARKEAAVKDKQSALDALCAVFFFMECFFAFSIVLIPSISGCIIVGLAAFVLIWVNCCVGSAVFQCHNAVESPGGANISGNGMIVLFNTMLAVGIILVALSLLITYGVVPLVLIVGLVGCWRIQDTRHAAAIARVAALEAAAAKRDLAERSARTRRALRTVEVLLAEIEAASEAVGLTDDDGAPSSAGPVTPRGMSPVMEIARGQFEDAAEVALVLPEPAPLEDWSPLPPLPTIEEADETDSELTDFDRLIGSPFDDWEFSSGDDNWLSNRSNVGTSSGSGKATWAEVCAYFDHKAMSGASLSEEEWDEE